MNAEANQDVFRILMLISDTGGGHRASADALATMLREVEPRISIEIVDVWTNYGLWPFNTFVPAYKYLCDHPQLWKLLYKFTMKNDCRVFVNVSGYVLCSSNFRTLFETVNPHLVCSLHPLCQDVPIKTLKECQPGDKLCIKDLFNDPNTQDIIEGLTEPIADGYP